MMRVTLVGMFASAVITFAIAGMLRPTATVLSPSVSLSLFYILRVAPSVPVGLSLKHSVTEVNKSFVYYTQSSQLIIKYEMENNKKASEIDKLNKTR